MLPDTPLPIDLGAVATVCSLLVLFVRYTISRIGALETKVNKLEDNLADQRSYKHAYRGEAGAFRTIIAMLTRLRNVLAPDAFHVASEELLTMAADIPDAETKLKKEKELASQ